MTTALHRRQHEQPPEERRRSYVRYRVQVERIQAGNCPRCDVLLNQGQDDWMYCPCCERRFAWAENGWEEQRITRIIGRCEHGA